MHTTIFLKKLLPFFVVTILLGISSVCIYYILINTIWAKKVLPYTSIQGEDISLNNESKLLEIYEQNFTLPDYIDIEIDIEIASEVGRLYLHEIDAAYSPNAQEILNEGKYTIDKFIENINLVYQQKEYTPVLTFDEMKLENWLQQSFDNLETGPKQIPLITKDLTGNITSCLVGKEGRALPKTEIAQAITNLKAQTKYKFDLEELSFNASENADSKLCEQLKSFKTNIAVYENLQLFNESEVDEYFQFQEINDKLDVNIKNELKLKLALQQFAANFEVAEIFPETKEYNGTVYLLGKYTPSKKLDLEKTIRALKSNLNSSLNIQPIKLEFVQSGNPTNYQGKPIVDYSTLISKGEAKFPYQKKKDATIQAINKGMLVLNGRFIPAQSNYSLIDDGLEARVYLYTQDGALLANDGNYSYNAGICGVATVMYRAGLLAGFPIKERHPHVQALAGYTHPYGVLVDAALYFRADIKQDLKFVNEYNYDILIVTDSKIEEGEFRYNIRLFAPPGSKKKEVKLGDFIRENYVKGIPFKERFTRYIDGVPEVIETKYYIDNL